MPIKIAKTAGFCFGVKRAVDAVYDALEKGQKIATLGDIIHNQQVIDDLSKKGVIVVDEPSQVPEGTILVLRTHGVTQAVLKEVEK